MREQESVLRAKMHTAILERVGRGTSDPEASAGDESGHSVADVPEGVDTGMLACGADELLAIETAKERLQDNTYGLCIICHGPISFKRLLALPTAQRCLSCQEHHERATWDHPETRQ